MSKQSVEEIKLTSHGLRGTLVETLQSESPNFSEEEYQLLKFHGTYQQDDRDLRLEARKKGLEKAWSFMVRTKMPGGAMTADQYLAHEDLAEDLANGTLRLTTRQGIQFHGIVKTGLKDVIRRICESGLTTWGACGDVVRNTMGPASPVKDVAHEDAQRLAEEISERFMARSTAYAEIWLDGKKLDISQGETDEEDPIYGKLYLPRKFKMAIAIPPRNDVDIYSQDVGFVPHVVDGVVDGYTILVGGGFGMSHGQTQTYPILAKPLCYVKRANVVDATVEIVKIQRDFGNREDRKRSRMKYLIDSKGLPWFRAELESRLSFPVQEAKPLTWTTVSDRMGWHLQGDGRWFCCVRVEQGRIQDVEGGPAYRTLFRELAKRYAFPIRITPNTNFLFHDVPESLKDEVDAFLKEHGIADASTLTEARKTAHACVALPTCGLSLAESERVFGGLMDQVDEVLRELGMAEEQLLIRMTGCPNGCARPYNTDIGFVGRAPGRYAMFVGGSSRGDRLAGIYRKVVKFEDIPGEIKTLLEAFKAEREAGELFSDWWGRTRTNGEAPHPEQFHMELAERNARLAGSSPEPQG